LGLGSGSGWLIAASTAFRVESVDHIWAADLVPGFHRGVPIPRVRLEYFISWRDIALVRSED
jgi:hypothetical protein